MGVYNLLIKKLKQKLKERYLTKDKIKKLGLGQEDIVRLIEETGEIEKYLTKDKRDELNLHSNVICELIIEKNRNKKEEIEKYLTKENIEEFRFGSDDISKLIAATGEIGKYLTKENIQKFRFKSDDIVVTIERAGVVDEYLVTGKIAKLGVPVTKIFRLIIETVEKTGEIEKYLTKDIVTKLGLMPSHVVSLIKRTGKIENYLTKENIAAWRFISDQIYELIIGTGKIENYLTKENIVAWRFTSDQICELIIGTGKIENYLTKENIAAWRFISDQIYELIIGTGKIENYLTKENIVAWRFTSDQICELIIGTGKIENYLTKENVATWGLTSESTLKLINCVLNDSNIHLIYDLGFDHTNIENCELLYKNLDYILERENRTEKKQIIERMYEKNNDIIKTKFEILDNKYLQILGENRINQISCYPEQVDDILTLNEKELRLLGRCLDLYESEDWTPLCKRILENIGTYTKLLETIDNIDEMHSEDIEDLTIVLLNENYLNIECIEDVKNFERIKQEKCIEMFKNGDVDDKINAICISKFGQSRSEIVQFIAKYAHGIDYIEDEDLQYYIKSVVEILPIRDTEVLNNIFKNVEPVKNVNSIAMERNLKNEYAKLYNKGLFTIDQAQKCENLGDNIYEVPIDENGNIANFNMIITSVAPFVTNSPDNFYKDWNRPALASQHFCASYIRRDMLGITRMPHLCYGFSDIKEDSLALSGSCDIYSSGAEFVSYADYDERYLPPNQQINETKGYNEMDFRRIQGGEKRQPDYIVVFRKDGEISNIDTAQMASEQFDEATGKKLPIVIIDEDKCLETESRLVGDMIEDFNNSPSREKAELICQKIRNNRVRNPSFSSDIDISYIQEYSEKNNNEPTVTMNEFEQCFSETKPEEREGMVKNFKSFYKALSKEQGKEVARNNEEKSR